MASKRPVAPDTPVRSFPTPNINDLVVVLDVDSRLPGYKPLEYGSLHPDQTRFKGAKLVYQEPLDGGDQFVRRIYATDRTDQDAYNYAVKYSAGSPNHPIYIRSYVEPRQSYAPQPEGTPDPFLKDAFLIEEEMAPVEGELNSLYVRVTRVYETLPGPVVTSFETNEAGQKVTVTSQRKSSSGYSLPAASATLSPSAQAEDAGVITEQIRTVPTVFARRQFSAERPDMLPQKFRAAVPDVETSEIVAGTAVQPTLGQGDISASETQQSLFVKQVSRRSRISPTYPRVFTETTVTRSGQLATVTSTLDDTIQSADTGPLVESSEVTDLGDGRSIKVTTEVDQVFEQPAFVRIKEDVTPPKFRAAVQELVEERTVDGIAAMPDPLAVGELEKREQQSTLFTKRISSRLRPVNTNVTLVESVRTNSGQLATVTSTLSDSPQTADTGPLVESSEVTNLGDGRTIKTTAQVLSLFGQPVFTRVIQDLVPTKFRDQTDFVVEQTVLGQASNSTSLPPGAVEATEQQVTIDTKRVSTRTRPPTSSRTLSGGFEYTTNLGGGVATVTETYSKTLISPPIDNFGVVSDVVENVGDGFVRRRVTLPKKTFTLPGFNEDGGAVFAQTMAPLRGQDYDPELDLTIPFTQVVASPDTVSVVTGPRRRSTPRDVDHTEVLKYDIEDVQQELDNYFWAVPTMTRVELPDRLLSVAVVFDRGFESTFGQGSGDTYYWKSSGGYFIRGKIAYDIEEGFRGNVPAFEAIFFLPKDKCTPDEVLKKVRFHLGSGVKYYPNPRPQAHEMLVFGRSGSQDQSKSVSFDSVSNSRGGKLSSSVDFTIIPATIHPALTVGTSTNPSESYPLSIGSVYPNVLPATDVTRFPTGRFIKEVNSTPYKFSYARVQAIVVDISSSYV